MALVRVLLMHWGLDGQWWGSFVRQVASGLHHVSQMVSANPEAPSGPQIGALLCPHPPRFQWGWLGPPGVPGPSNTNFCIGTSFFSLHLRDARNEPWDSGDSGPRPTLPSRMALGHLALHLSF